MAKRADRQTELPPRPFDSWFEVDTALALAMRGFRLSTQVQVARKRIDLVVEGNDGVRLAVECDGDVWHGPEQYEHDMFRQRQLERAGWTFVRVRESLFYSDEVRAIGEAVAACEELGIEPGGRRTSLADASILDVSTAGAPQPAAGAFTSAVTHEPDAAGMNALAQQAGTGFEPVPVTRSEVTQRSGDPAVEIAQSLLPDDRDGPYTGYASKDYPDPRTSPLANVREAVLDIVATDGPLPKGPTASAR